MPDMDTAEWSYKSDTLRRGYFCSISETSLSFSSPFFVDLSVTLIIQHPLTSSSERRRKNRLVPHPLFWEPPKKKQIRSFTCKNERSSKRKGNTLSKDVLFR